MLYSGCGLGGFASILAPKLFLINKYHTLGPNFLVENTTSHRLIKMGSSANIFNKNESISFRLRIEKDKD